MGTILCCEVTEIGFGDLDSFLNIVGHTCLAQASMRDLTLTLRAPSIVEKDEISNLMSLFFTFTGALWILVSSVMFRPVLILLETHIFEHLQSEGPFPAQLTN